ncbi:MAG: hypothetical protein HRT61_01160 [Ekhidna sp.]|nr:hypothetical protein [Ekhidna sp.]
MIKAEELESSTLVTALRHITASQTKMYKDIQQILDDDRYDPATRNTEIRQRLVQQASNHFDVGELISNLLKTENPLS